MVTPCVGRRRPGSVYQACHPQPQHYTSYILLEVCQALLRRGLEGGKYFLWGQRSVKHLNPHGKGTGTFSKTKELRRMGGPPQPKEPHLRGGLPPSPLSYANNSTRRRGKHPTHVCTCKYAVFSVIGIDRNKWMVTPSVGRRRPGSVYQACHPQSQLYLSPATEIHMIALSCF